MRSTVGLILSIVLVGILHVSTMRDAHASFSQAVELLKAGDFDDAKELLSELAAQNDTRAAALLGQLLTDGIFFDEDIEAGIQLLEDAVAQDEILAFYPLGLILLGLPFEGSYFGLRAKYPNPKQVGVEYLRRAAQAGDPAAMFLLAYAHMSGDGTEVELERAKYWLENAAESGHVLARSVVAALPARETVPLPSEQITDMLELAPDGDATLHLSLAIALLNARLEEPTRIHGLKWLYVAAIENSDDALRMIENFKNMLSAPILLNARREAETWLMETAKQPGTHLAYAAAWCERANLFTLECVGAANDRHVYCQAPYFPGYFDDYYLSPAYNHCRRALEDEPFPDYSGQALD